LTRRTCILSFDGADPILVFIFASCFVLSVGACPEETRDASVVHLALSVISPLKIPGAYKEKNLLRKILSFSFNWDVSLIPKSRIKKGGSYDPPFCTACTLRFTRNASRL
jgi:hypothetical protein